MSDELDEWQLFTLQGPAAPLDGAAAARVWADVESALRRPAVSTVTTLDTTPPGAGHGRPRWPVWLAIAAVSVMAIGGLVVANRGTHKESEPVATEPGTVPAVPLTTDEPMAPGPPATEPTTADVATVDSSTAAPVPPIKSSDFQRVAGTPVTISGASIIAAARTTRDAGWIVTDRSIVGTDARGVPISFHTLTPVAAETGDGVHSLGDELAVVARTDAAIGRVVVTAIGPSSWTENELPLARATPVGIAFADPLHGWIVAADPQSPPGRGVLFRTVDGGQTFERVADDAPAPLAFADEMTGWASGSGLFVTQDGGVTWTQLTPPGWDATGPDPAGPGYSIVRAVGTSAIVRQQSPTGMQAQIRYLATDDLGGSWRDITPPGVAEVSNTGPSSSMVAIDADHLVGIDGQGGWFESTDGGATWATADIGVAAQGVAMADADTGWLWTGNTLYTVAGSDRQIDPTAYVLPPFEPTPGCTWQPEIRGQEGTGGRFLTWTTFLNTGTQPCAWPTITGATATSVVDGTEIELSGGDGPLAQIVDPLPGAAATITLWSPTTYEACEGEPASVPMTDFRFEFGDAQSPPLPIVLEGACGIGYTVEPIDAA